MSNPDHEVSLKEGPDGAAVTFQKTEEPAAATEKNNASVDDESVSFGLDAPPPKSAEEKPDGKDQSADNNDAAAETKDEQDETVEKTPAGTDKAANSFSFGLSAYRDDPGSPKDKAELEADEEPAAEKLEASPSASKNIDSVEKSGASEHKDDEVGDEKKDDLSESRDAPKAADDDNATDKAEEKAEEKDAMSESRGDPVAADAADGADDDEKKDELSESREAPVAAQGDEDPAKDNVSEKLDDDEKKDDLDESREAPKAADDDAVSDKAEEKDDPSEHREDPVAADDDDAEKKDDMSESRGDPVAADSDEEHRADESREAPVAAQGDEDAAKDDASEKLDDDDKKDDMSDSRGDPVAADGAEEHQDDEKKDELSESRDAPKAADGDDAADKAEEKTEEKNAMSESREDPVAADGADDDEKKDELSESRDAPAGADGADEATHDENKGEDPMSPEESGMRPPNVSMAALPDMGEKSGYQAEEAHHDDAASPGDDDEKKEAHSAEDKEPLHADNKDDEDDVEKKSADDDDEPIGAEDSAVESGQRPPNVSMAAAATSDDQIKPPETLNGTLEVTILRCSDVPVMDTVGSVDPFCVLRLEGGADAQEQRTAVRENERNPTWADEPKQFEVNDSMTETLRFRLVDEDTFGNDGIAEASIPIDGLTQGIATEKTIELTGENGAVSARIRLLPKDFGVEEDVPPSAGEQEAIQAEPEAVTNTAEEKSPDAAEEKSPEAEPEVEAGTAEAEAKPDHDAHGEKAEEDATPANAADDRALPAEEAAAEEPRDDNDATDAPPQEETKADEAADESPVDDDHAAAKNTAEGRGDDEPEATADADEQEDKGDDAAEHVTAGTLEVTVLRCSDVPVMDTVGSVDPFCVLRLDGGGDAQEQRTAVRENERNPTWADEPKQFAVADSVAESLRIRLVDEDTFGNDGIATTTIPLDLLERDTPVEGEIELTGANGPVVMLVRLHAIDFGVPPSPHADGFAASQPFMSTRAYEKRKVEFQATVDGTDGEAEKEGSRPASRTSRRPSVQGVEAEPVVVAAARFAVVREVADQLFGGHVHPTALSPKAQSTMDDHAVQETFAGTLEVTVLRCSDVPVMDTVGSVDPFCVLRLEGGADAQEQRTAVRENERNPTWADEPKQFQVKDSMTEALRIRLVDEDTFGNDGIAAVTIPINGLTQAYPTEAEVELTGADGHVVMAHVRIVATDFGLPADDEFASMRAAAPGSAREAVPLDHVPNDDHGNDDHAVATTPSESRRHSNKCEDAPAETNEEPEKTDVVEPQEEANADDADNADNSDDEKNDGARSPDPEPTEPQPQGEPQGEPQEDESEAADDTARYDAAKKRQSSVVEPPVPKNDDELDFDSAVPLGGDEATGRRTAERDERMAWYALTEAAGKEKATLPGFAPRTVTDFDYGEALSESRKRRSHSCVRDVPPMEKRWAHLTDSEKAQRRIEERQAMDAAMETVLKLSPKRQRPTKEEELEDEEALARVELEAHERVEMRARIDMYEMEQRIIRPEGILLLEPAIGKEFEAEEAAARRLFFYDTALATLTLREEMDRGRLVATDAARRNAMERDLARHLEFQRGVVKRYQPSCSPHRGPLPPGTVAVAPEPAPPKGTIGHLENLLHRFDAQVAMDLRRRPPPPPALETEKIPMPPRAASAEGKTPVRESPPTAPVPPTTAPNIAGAAPRRYVTQTAETSEAWVPAPRLVGKGPTNTRNSEKAPPLRGPRVPLRPQRVRDLHLPAVAGAAPGAAAGLPAIKARTSSERLPLTARADTGAAAVRAASNPQPPSYPAPTSYTARHAAPKASSAVPVRGSSVVTLPAL